MFLITFTLDPMLIENRRAFKMGLTRDKIGRIALSKSIEGGERLALAYDVVQRLLPSLPL